MEPNVLVLFVVDGFGDRTRRREGDGTGCKVVAVGGVVLAVVTVVVRRWTEE